MFYTVHEGQGDLETREELTAQQILASRPVLVELYEYKNDVTIETRIERRIEKYETFPKRMQLMVIDYFEVGHGKRIMVQKIPQKYIIVKKPLCSS